MADGRETRGQPHGRGATWRRGTARQSSAYGRAVPTADARVTNVANASDQQQLAMKGESLYKISALTANSPEICRRHYAALVPEAMADTVEFRPCVLPPLPLTLTTRQPFVSCSLVTGVQHP